ncbi:transposase [Paenibacillus sp. GYB003]|uniref:transposase n=1 Tax=Paenibacillus sp. GYB003 TaxID=2994392 RepID=UPI002F967823
MKKPLYDETYKRKTVQYVKESGKAVAEVARELKIKDSTLYGWMKSMEESRKSLRRKRLSRKIISLNARLST